jgi:hypothetical protein
MEKSLKFVLLFVVVSLFLSSCLKDGADDDEIGGPDPLAWDYEVSWVEIEKRTDTEDWQAINGGDTLKLSFSYTDAARKNLVGIYYYSSHHLNIALDKLGNVKMQEDDISFIYPLTTAANTVKLPSHLIQHGNETLLIIRNTLTTPATEVKYKQVGFKEH